MLLCSHDFFSLIILLVAIATLEIMLYWDCCKTLHFFFIVLEQNWDPYRHLFWIFLLLKLQETLKSNLKWKTREFHRNGHRNLDMDLCCNLTSLWSECAAGMRWWDEDTNKRNPHRVMVQNHAHIQYCCTQNDEIKYSFIKCMLGKFAVLQEQSGKWNSKKDQ